MLTPKQHPTDNGSDVEAPLAALRCNAGYATRPWPAVLVALCAAMGCVGTAGDTNASSGSTSGTPSGVTSTEASHPSLAAPTSNEEGEPSGDATADPTDREVSDGDAVGLCAPTDVSRGSTRGALRRLSRPQLELTLRHLLGTAYDGAHVSDTLAALPADLLTNAGDFAEVPLPGLPLALAKMAKAVAEVAKSDAAWRTRWASCLSDLSAADDNCARNFVESFGAQVLRRPVSADEAEDYVQFYRDIGRGPQGFDALLRRLLQAPELVFHLELEGEPTDDGRLRLTAYEVASRLSYALTDAPPDSALQSATAADALGVTVTLREHALRLLSSREGQGKLRDFGRYYAALTNHSDPPEHLLRAHGLEGGSGLAEEAQREMLDFFQKTVVEGGTFEDLMLSRETHTTSSRLLQIFEATGGDAEGNLTTPNHPGLIHRPALLMSSAERTNPIVRGAFVQKRILCADLGVPADAAAIAKANAEIRADAQQPNRQAVANATSGDACLGCHARVNPVGFVLEGFDQLAARRSEEVVLDAEGNVVATFPVDSRVTNVVLGAQTLAELSNSVELAEALSHSNEAKRCFAQRALEYYSAKALDPVADRCAQADAKAAAASGRMTEIVSIAVANEDIFWRKLEQ